jgi:vacuolar-type H+-ATPase subunit C/Vma6
MSTHYIYAGTRAKVLENTLLSETQLERLLGAKSIEELFKVLQDTFLAPLLAKHEKSDVEAVFGISLNESRSLLAQIAPEPEILDILWLRYDFFNLNAILKGIAVGQERNDIIAHCFPTAKYGPEKILNAVETRTLAAIDPYLERARSNAERATHIFKQDLVINRCYFDAVKDIAVRHPKNQFIAGFVALQIDMFNIFSALRLMRLILENTSLGEVFVPGGNVRPEDLADESSALAQLTRFGGEVYWKEAVGDFKQTGDYSLLEKTRDDYIAMFLKQASADTFSVAPLFSYFTAMKNNIQIIKSIITAKRHGMREGDLRVMMRRLYR